MDVKAKNANIMITIPEELKNQIEVVAAHDCRSRNNMITKILMEFMESGEVSRILEASGVSKDRFVK